MLTNLRRLKTFPEEDIFPPTILFLQERASNKVFNDLLRFLAS